MGTVKGFVRLEDLYGVVLYQPTCLLEIPPPSRWEIIRTWLCIVALGLAGAVSLVLSAVFVCFAPPQDRSGYIVLFALCALLGILQGALTSKGSR